MLKKGLIDQFTHYIQRQQLIKQHRIEFRRMSQKFVAETPALLLQSQIRDNSEPSPHSLHRSLKSPNSQIHPLTVNSPLIRKPSETKSQQSPLSSDHCYTDNSLYSPVNKNFMKGIQSDSTSSQLNRLKSDMELQHRNFVYELQFYIRQRIRDLMTIQELLLANQYQRLFVYVQTQLLLLRRSQESYLLEDEFCKPSLTKDTFLKSGIQDDCGFHEMINNLIGNLAQGEKTTSSVISVIKKLSSQTNVPTKKLAGYFQLYPFGLTKTNAASSLANKFIEMGYTQGKQITDLLAKSVNQNSKGKYSLALQESALKSQMSKLIQQHSISKLKGKKSSQ